MGLDELEATLYYQIIKERIEIIKKFQQITDDDMREKVIQEYLFNHLWGLYGAVFAQPIADIVTVIISMLVCLTIMHKQLEKGLK